MDPVKYVIAHSSSSSYNAIYNGKHNTYLVTTNITLGPVELLTLTPLLGILRVLDDYKNEL